MFADYRVPQVNAFNVSFDFNDCQALLYLGGLEYTAELTELLKSKTLQPSDLQEIEIRGNSIWSVEVSFIRNFFLPHDLVAFARNESHSLRPKRR